MTYLTTCPSCGGSLAAVIGPPDWAPWLCAECSRGWWPAELRHRDGWDPTTRSFDDNVRLTVVAEMDQETARAAEVGTSVLAEHLEVLPIERHDELAALPKRIRDKLPESLKAAIAEHNKRAKT